MPPTGFFAAGQKTRRAVHKVAARGIRFAARCIGLPRGAFGGCTVSGMVAVPWPETSCKTHVSRGQWLQWL